MPTLCAHRIYDCPFHMLFFVNELAGGRIACDGVDRVCEGCFEALCADEEPEELRRKIFFDPSETTMEELRDQVREVREEFESEGIGMHSMVRRQLEAWDYAGNEWEEERGDIRKWAASGAQP